MRMLRVSEISVCAKSPVLLVKATYWRAPLSLCSFPLPHLSSFCSYWYRCEALGEESCRRGLNPCVTALGPCLGLRAMSITTGGAQLSVWQHVHQVAVSSAHHTQSKCQGTNNRGRKCGAQSILFVLWFFSFLQNKFCCCCVVVKDEFYICAVWT